MFMSEAQDCILDTEIFDGLKQNPYKKEKIVSDWIYPNKDFTLLSLITGDLTGHPKPKLKSLRMLGHLIDNSEQISVQRFRSCTIELIHDLVLIVKSNSSRYYSIKASFNIIDKLFPSPLVNGYTITVKGARWKKDILDETKHSVNLCLHTSTKFYGNRKLTLDYPIGDKISTLCLHLINDVELGLRIPLIAQFLIASRSTLSKIDTFQEEFIVWNDMIDYADEEPSCCEMTEMLEDYDCGCADATAYEEHMVLLASELSQTPDSFSV